MNSKESVNLGAYSVKQKKSESHKLKIEIKQDVNKFEKDQVSSGQIIKLTPLNPL